MSTHEITEPLFITEEIEAEMIAAGYVFEPPKHVCTSHASGELFNRPRDQPNNVIPIFGQADIARSPQNKPDQ